MKARLKIRTELNKKDQKNFYYLSAFRINPLRLILLILLTLAISILSNIDDLSNIFSIVKNWLIFSVVIILGIIVSVQSKVGELYKHRKPGDNTDQVKLDFYDQLMKVHTDNKNTTVDIKYEDIHKIYESKSYFLIYINSARTSIVRKSDLDQAEEDSLRKLLQEECGNIYKKI